jgi:hypothetical protein
MKVDFSLAEALLDGHITSVVYQTSAGLTCTATSGSSGETVGLSLTQGIPETLQAWIVLGDEITPDNPRGNPAIIGLAGIYPEFYSTQFSTIAATGPAICTGGQNGSDLAPNQVYLHVAGEIHGWQHCGRRFKSSFISPG